MTQLPKRHSYKNIAVTLQISDINALPSLIQCCNLHKQSYFAWYWLEAKGIGVVLHYLAQLYLQLNRYDTKLIPFHYSTRSFISLFSRKSIFHFAVNESFIFILCFKLSPVKYSQESSWRASPRLSNPTYLLFSRVSFIAWRLLCESKKRCTLWTLKYLTAERENGRPIIHHKKNPVAPSAVLQSELAFDE